MGQYGKKITQFIGHTNRVTQACFGKNNDRIFTASADNKIIEWNLQGKLLRRFSGHANEIHRLAFSEKGNTFYSAGGGGKIKKWLLDSKIAEKFQHPQIPTTTLFTVGIGAKSLSYDGSLLATGGEKKYLSNYARFTDRSPHALPIRIWDLNNKKTYDLEGHKADISALAFSPDAKSLLSGSMDGSLVFWTLPTSKNPESESKIIGTHEGACSYVQWAQDGSLFISTGTDSLLNIWNTDGKLMQSLKGKDWIRTATIFPDGKTILTGATDGSLKLWEVGGAEEPSAIWKEHQTAVGSICFSPDGKYLASGDLSNTLILWNDEGEIIWKKDLSGTSLSGSGAIKDIEFSLDSRQIIYASADGGANILDLNGNLLQSMQETAVKFTGVGFAPDGNTVFCAGDDGMLRFYYTLEGYLEHQGINN